MNAAAVKGTVYLVGAGPGDPELLTLRAARLLETADLVLHDDLVPEAVLRMIHGQALVTSVGKRCGQARITQAEIHALMIDGAHRGLSVVRLKSGDPLVFGRAAEELAALREAEVEVEIVPGVSAVFAAGASLQLPLTDRQSASKLILITGHHAADKASPPPIWQGTLPEDATLAIYMPGRDFASLAKDLTSAGVSGDMPCVAVSHAASAEQRADATTLSDLATMTAGPAPVIVLVGRAMASLVNKDTEAQEIVERAVGSLAI